MNTIHQVSKSFYQTNEIKVDVIYNKLTMEQSFIRLKAIEVHIIFNKITMEQSLKMEHLFILQF